MISLTTNLRCLASTILQREVGTFDVEFRPLRGFSLPGLSPFGFDREAKVALIHPDGQTWNGENPLVFRVTNLTNVVSLAEFLHAALGDLAASFQARRLLAPCESTCDQPQCHCNT